MRVLIVEDEPLIGMMLQEYLEMIGMDVVDITDCISAALAVIASKPFDIAIVDVNLRDGETCHEVVEALISKSIPFVLSSGDHAPSLPWRGSPILPKPYTISDVERVMAELAS